jgi:hypothetical protein
MDGAVPSPTAEVGVVDARGEAVVLGPILDHEHDELFALFAEIVAHGDGFPHAPPLTRAQYDDTWVRPVSLTVVARRVPTRRSRAPTT